MDPVTKTRSSIITVSFVVIFCGRFSDSLTIILTAVHLVRNFLLSLLVQGPVEEEGFGSLRGNPGKINS